MNLLQQTINASTTLPNETKLLLLQTLNNKEKLGMDIVSQDSLEDLIMLLNE